MSNPVPQRLADLGRPASHGFGEDLLRPMEVARWLGVSRTWLYEAARAGRIPSVRLGGPDGPLRFIAADVEGWIREAWTERARDAR